MKVSLNSDTPSTFASGIVLLALSIAIDKGLFGEKDVVGTDWRMVKILDSEDSNVLDVKVTIQTFGGGEGVDIHIQTDLDQIWYTDENGDIFGFG